jgi:polysaccharide biosynthesis transport protein
MTVADVYRALWRRRFLILVMTLLLLAVDAFLTSQQTKKYTASTLVRVEQKGTTASEQFGSLQTGALLAQTYARIAETSSVAERVREQLGSSVPQSAIDIHGSQVGDLELLDISATNTNPKLAARIANEVPEALAHVVNASGRSPDVITTVDLASAPSSPSSPNMKLNLALGLIIGLILNGGLVLLAAAFADRVGDTEELEAITGVPVIATVPTLPLVSVSQFVHRPELAEAPPPPPQRRSTASLERRSSA